MFNRASAPGYARSDLLVTVAGTAIGAAVIPVLLAAGPLNARTSACVWMQRTLGVGQAMYMAEHDDQYAGVNTSGAEYQGFGVGPGGADFFSDALIGDTSSTTPTTTWDWISPTLGDKAGFSPNRAERFADIMNRASCPEATRLNDELYNEQNVADRDDFDRVFLKGVRQVSYLQPAPFHFYSSAADPSDIPFSGPPGGDYWWRTSLSTGFDAPVITPADFRPVLHRVGTSPAEKIMHADGTRYLNDNGVLDIDVSPSSSYGSFGTNTPVYDASRTYGRGAGSAPDNYELSFRHEGGMYATMFDGSVKWISREEAWTDPTPWYPGGSLFNGEGATQESIEFVAKNLPGGIIP